jgi:S-(hydroxymethyl)glutathione dehydrogenase / alcohol dehydrogenase
MKAAVLHELPGTLSVEEVQIDAPGPGEVLIKTVAAGVCHSDLHFLEGKMGYPTPTVLGHESAGVVEAVGDGVRHVQPGDHVITCLSVFCGHCESCLTGRPWRCFTDESARSKDAAPRLRNAAGPMFQFLGLSSFAEWMLVGENALVRIRDDMPLEQASLLGCGVMTGLGAVFNTARVRPGETVAVIGCGGVGLACIQGARIAGAGRIIAVDRVADKLETARQLGASDIVDGSATDPVEAVRELTGGGVDHAFEAIGLPATVEQCIAMLIGDGTATVVGMMPADAEVRVKGSDFMAAKHIQCSIMGSNRFRVDIPRYVNFCLDGRLKLDQMISARRPIEEINLAFDDMKAATVARSVIVL